MPRRPTATSPGRYPFPVKVKAWIAVHAGGLAAFATLTGLPYGTLNGWVKRGRRVPAWAIQQVADKTGLSSEYWTDDALPYPPPKKRQRTEDERELLRVVKRLNEEQRRELLRCASDPDRLERFLLAWRLAQE